jgi:hypothetical protein
MVSIGRRIKSPPLTMFIALPLAAERAYRRGRLRRGVDGLQQHQCQLAAMAGGGIPSLLYLLSVSSSPALMTLDSLPSLCLQWYREFILSISVSLSTTHDS